MRSTHAFDRIRDEARTFDDARRILNLDEVARFCSVPVPRVLDWIDRGLLHATSLPDGAHRITADDFSAFVGKSDILGRAASDRSS